MNNLNNFDKEKCPCCNEIADDGLCHSYIDPMETLEHIAIMEKEKKRIWKKCQHSLNLLEKAHKAKNKKQLSKILLQVSNDFLRRKINMESLSILQKYCLGRMKEKC